MFGMLPERHTLCLSKGHSSMVPAAAHSPRQRVVPLANKPGVDSQPDGSNDFKFNSSISNNPSSSAGQQKSAWGSSWSKRPKVNVNKPVSFFDKSSADSTAPACQQSPSSSSSGTAPSAQLDPQLEASIRQSVDRAAETLQEIITEVLNEMLIEEASSYVMDEQGPSIQINQAVRNAVVKRLEWLDANFLAALNAYLAAPSVQHNNELSELLRAVRTEVLDLVAARLPPAVQVLNSALQHSSRAGRSAIVQIALAGGEGSVPAASLDALGAAAHQLVDDMEDQQIVADRVLLARLVLLREELRSRAEEQDARQFWAGTQAASSGGDSQATTTSSLSTTAPSSSPEGPSNFHGFHRSNLPVRCATFMKELLSVPERDRRLGLLSKAFQEDWVGEAANPDQAEEMPSMSRPKDSSFQNHTKPETLDIVRPGRFLSTLHAMRAELEQNFLGSASMESGPPNMQLLQHFDVIKVESMVALDRLQSSRPTGDERHEFDYEVEMAGLH